MTEKFHKGFLEALDASEGPRWQAAVWLNQKGYEVTVPVMEKAETHAEHKKYADGGDLFADGKRVEVKGLGYDFHSVESWPFKDVIVYAAHAWEKADPKPWTFLYLNKARTHLALVYGRTSDQWTVEERGDKRRPGHKQKHMIAPISCIHKIVELS